MPRKTAFVLFGGGEDVMLRHLLDCPPKLTEDYGNRFISVALLHYRHAQ